MAASLVRWEGVTLSPTWKKQVGYSGLYETTWSLNSVNPIGRERIYRNIHTGLPLKCLSKTIMPSSPSKKLEDELLCDVFISHQGTDTKRTAAGLLYDRFKLFRLHPFFDSKSMKPGDKLFDKIGTAIRGCKVGVLIFSPNYCSSYFCLHELALLMECKKKVIPIYCDVHASDLKVADNGSYTAEELKRFRWAVEEAKQFVALTFDMRNGDWSEFIASATDIVVRSLNELDVEEGERSCHTLDVWYCITVLQIIKCVDTKGYKF